MTSSEFLTSLKTLHKEQLLQVKGLGDVLVDNILNFVESDRYKTLIVEFEELERQNKGLTIISTNRSKENLPLSGVTVCITGTFEIPRPTIQKKLELLGAQVTNTVSKKTTYLLAGSDAGSKKEKAELLGIPILENLDMLENPGELRKIDIS